MSQSVCQLLWAKCIGHVLFIAVHNLFSIEWNQISDSTERLLERALQILTIDPYAICGWKKISLENGHVLVKTEILILKLIIGIKFQFSTMDLPMLVCSVWVTNRKCQL